MSKMMLYKQQIDEEEGNKLVRQLSNMGFGIFLKEEDYERIEHKGDMTIVVRPRGHPLQDNDARMPAGWYIKSEGLFYKPVPLINYKSKTFIFLMKQPGQDGYIVYYKQVLNGTILDRTDTPTNTNDPFYTRVIHFFNLSDILFENDHMSKEAYLLSEFIFQVGENSKCMRLFYIYIKETLKKGTKGFNQWIKNLDKNSILWIDAQKLRAIRHFCVHNLFKELSIPKLENYKNSDEFILDSNLKEKITFGEEDLDPVKWLAFYIANKEI
ncbi:MAG: hypothetical protein ABII27_01735 [bacterium]